MNYYIVGLGTVHHTVFKYNAATGFLKLVRK